MKLIPLQAWIERGERQHFVAKRLRDAALLTPETLQRMRAEGEELAGKDVVVSPVAILNAENLATVYEN